MDVVVIFELDGQSGNLHVLGSLDKDRPSGHCFISSAHAIDVVVIFVAT